MARKWRDLVNETMTPAQQKRMKAHAAKVRGATKPVEITPFDILERQIAALAAAADVALDTVRTLRGLAQDNAEAMRTLIQPAATDAAPAPRAPKRRPTFGT